MPNPLKKIPFRIVVRRYQMIILGCLMLVSGAVIPAKWEPPFKPYSAPAPTLDALPKRPWIALTFDDGPHSGRTEQLLEVLEKANVPATFFVVGKMADRYPQLIRQIAQAGHEIANHTYNHPNLAQLTDREVVSELNQTRDAIQRLSGQRSLLYRPPGGEYTRRTVRAASQAGYRMVLWSVISHDVNGLPPQAMTRRILAHARDNGVVLMHSGTSNTLVMLPDLIAQLKSRGYHFVTMSTLLHSPSPQKAPADILHTASKKTY